MTTQFVIFDVGSEDTEQIWRQMFSFRYAL